MDRGADEGVFFADFALQISFPRPVEKSKRVAVDYEPRWADVGLDDVFGLRSSVFEAGWGVGEDGVI